MKNLKFLLVILLITGKVHSVHGQTEYKLGGHVYNQETGEVSIGAAVFIRELGYGTVTDENGYYLLKMVEGKYTLIISSVGYETVEKPIVVADDMTTDITLAPLVTTIREVVISDRNEEENVTATETGHITLTQKDLAALPYLLGESDPLRIIQLMPGVHTAGEGTTGFYVRGGAIDQNLILLDNSVVYNPSHLFGFFSVFNGSAISALDLYKGGVPASYGGRLSSITNITTRKGDDEKLRAEGGIGLIAANILVEGPIKKNKGSFLVAGRRTYVDLFINPIRELFSVEEKLNYYFYDLNVNMDYSITQKDHLRFRSYIGKDDFMFGTGSSFRNNMRWGNRTTSLQWLHRFRDDIFGELSLHAVSYDMNFSAGINQYQFDIRSDIRDNGLIYQVDIKRNRHHVSFGLNYTHHAVSPNNLESRSEDVALDFSKKVKLYAHEAAFFVNDKVTLSDKIELSAGIRFTGYSQLGPFTRYVEDGNFQILDTIDYARNERIQSYYNAEPRLSVRYLLSQASSLKLSYDRTYQYMHMAPLSSASLPMDMWVTSSAVVKPQSADQYTLGYFRNFADNSLEASAVVYHKEMENQLEYRDGVIIGYSKGFNFDDNFVFGRGTSSGVELMLRKNRGRLHGMVAYTLSKTTRKFDELNQGKSFPAKYDRLHDVSVMANLNLNSKWTFSTVFVYGTGNALNLPVARYVIQGNVINEYGSRNSARMPAYHRMDLAATYVARRTDKFESSWIFSIYNVYNRRNPYYIYFEMKGNLEEYELKTNLKQVSLFPIIPAVTYRLKF